MNSTTDTDAGSAPPAASREWGRLRKAIRIVLICFAALLAVACIYVVVINCWGERRLRAAFGLLRERNLPTSLDYLRRDEDEEDGTDNGARYFRAVAELVRSPFAWEKDILPYRPELGKPIDPRIASELRKFVGKQKEFFSLFAKARQCSRYRYGLTFGSSSANKQKGLSGLTLMAFQQSHLALERQAAGDPEGALDACDALLDLSLSLNSEPYQIVGLRRANLDHSVHESIEQTLSRTTPTVASLQQLCKKALREEQHADLRGALKADLACLAEEARHLGRHIAYNDYVAEDTISSKQYRKEREREVGSAELIREQCPDYSFRPSVAKVRFRLKVGRVWSLVCPGTYKWHLARLLRGTLRWYDEAAKPSDELASEANRVLAEKTANWPTEHPAARAALQFVERRARMRVVAAALSAECYRIRNGTWPEALTDAEDDVLPDPFDGQKLRYERTDDGRVMYSVGKNQKDDGGERDNVGVKDDIAFRLLDGTKRNRP